MSPFYAHSTPVINKLWDCKESGECDSLNFLHVTRLWHCVYACVVKGSSFWSWQVPSPLNSDKTPGCKCTHTSSPAPASATSHRRLADEDSHPTSCVQTQAHTMYSCLRRTVNAQLLFRYLIKTASEFKKHLFYVHSHKKGRHRTVCFFLNPPPYKQQKLSHLLLQWSLKHL